MDGITIQLTRKNIKNINLRVYPGKGIVKVSSPRHIRKSIVVEFVESRLDWVKKQLNKKRKDHFKNSELYQTGDTIYVWGDQKSLIINERNKKPEVNHSKEGGVEMSIRPQSSIEKREAVLDEWYRTMMKREIATLIKKWELKMGVQVLDFGVKKMKTRWGTCNIKANRIWLNLELAKHPKCFLEFVVVHEMVHLLERLHSKKFYNYMDHFLPNWKEIDNLLR